MKQSKLPTLLGLLLLVLGITGGVVLVQSRHLLNLSASPEETPEQVKITDVTDKSFVISWVTDKPTSGFISYGTSESLGIAVQQKGSQASNVHYSIVENLKPNTLYYFKIGSGKTTYTNNGKLYQQKTAPTLSSPPQTDVIFGTIKTQMGTPAQNVVVYATLPGATMLSALTNEEGKWNIPLSTARNASFTSYIPYNPQTQILDILVIAGVTDLATAKTTTGVSHPVPVITLGKAYDFTKLTPLPQGSLPEAEILLPDASSEEQQSGSSSDGRDLENVKIVTLVTPRDKEATSSSQPKFSGTGTAGLTFSIKIAGPTNQSGQITVPKNSSWFWIPTSKLSTGQYNTTVTWTDEKGQTKTLTRQLAVTASVANTTDQTVTSAGGPATTVTPASSPAVKSTTTSSKAKLNLPSTASGIPISGNLTPSLVVLIIGIVLVLAGLFMPRAKAY